MLTTSPKPEGQPCNDRFRLSPTSSSPWPPPRVNPAWNEGRRHDSRTFSGEATKRCPGALDVRPRRRVPLEMDCSAWTVALRRRHPLRRDRALRDRRRLGLIEITQGGCLADGLDVVAWIGRYRSGSQATPS